jgi:hypothetical protein
VGCLGVLGQPEPVRRGRGELALEVVIVHGRAWLAPVLAAPGPDRAVPSVLLAEPPGGSGSHGVAGRLGFVSEQPAPEFRVCLVGGVRGVGPVSGFQVSLAHRVLEPAVVGVVGLRTRKDTATGTPSAASSDTSGYIIFSAGSPGTGRPRRGEDFVLLLEQTDPAARGAKFLGF